MTLVMKYIEASINRSGRGEDQREAGFGKSWGTHYERKVKKPEKDSEGIPLN